MSSSSSDRELSLDIRGDDGLLLWVSPALCSLLLPPPCSLDGRLSLYSFLSPEETWRLLEALLKGNTVDKQPLIFRFQSQGRSICLQAVAWERPEKDEGRTLFRVTWKDLHSSPEEETSLGGFTLHCSRNTYCLTDISHNYAALLGHANPRLTHLGSPLFKWIHPEDEMGLKSLVPGKILRFQNAGGGYEVFKCTEMAEDRDNEGLRMGFKAASSSACSVFSTLLQKEARVREIPCNNGGLPLPNLGHRNFLELISSRRDLHYIESRLREKVHGLTRLYEIRMHPQRVLLVQTHFAFLPNEDVLAHHFIVKDREEEDVHKSLTASNNNNSLKRKWELGEEEDSTTQKNKLLRELLNINYSAAGEGQTPSSYPPAPSSSSSNSRILQLLNSKTHDRRKTVPSSVASSLPKSSSSFMCSQNPALADLLSKPPYHGSSSVPPPVPTKWHQEPREKLPRHIMRKYLPPHPAERSKIGGEAPLISFPPEPDHDPMLSEILDGVIDIQEKNHPGGGEQLQKQQRINLSDIEKFLSASTEASQSSVHQTTTRSSSSSVAGSHFYSSGNEGALPRMNELLQVIPPPNVTIPLPSGDGPPFTSTMHQRRLQQPPPSFSTSSRHNYPGHNHHPYSHPQQQQQQLSSRQPLEQEGPSTKGGGGERGGAGSLLLQLLSE